MKSVFPDVPKRDEWFDAWDADEVLLALVAQQLNSKPIHKALSTEQAERCVPMVRNTDCLATSAGEIRLKVDHR